MKKLAAYVATLMLVGVGVLGVSSAATAGGDSMTLTGNPTMGGTMTIQFNDGVTPSGNFFDIWMCPNKTVQPADGGEEGDCEVVTFWARDYVANYGTGAGQDPVLSMKWVIKNEPTPALKLNGEPYLGVGGEELLIDPPGYDDEEFVGWCAYNGWYFSINDYQGGANSNWSEALVVNCSDPAPEPEPEPEPSLANTGADAASSNMLLAGVSVLLVAGLTTVVWARRRHS